MSCTLHDVQLPQSASASTTASQCTAISWRRSGGAGGIAEGLPESVAGATLPKFRPGGLLIVHCGGGAGLFSAMIGGWASGAVGSAPVMREIR